MNYTEMQYSDLVTDIDDGCCPVVVSPGNSVGCEPQTGLNTPILSYPANVASLNDDWTACSPNVFGGWDPPTTLNKASSMAPSSLPPDSAAPGPRKTPHHASATAIPIARASDSGLSSATASASSSSNTYPKVTLKLNEAPAQDPASTGKPKSENQGLMGPDEKLTNDHNLHQKSIPTTSPILDPMSRIDFGGDDASSNGDSPTSPLNIQGFSNSRTSSEIHAGIPLPNPSRTGSTPNPSSDASSDPGHDRLETIKSIQSLEQTPLNTVANMEQSSPEDSNPPTSSSVPVIVQGNTIAWLPSSKANLRIHRISFGGKIVALGQAFSQVSPSSLALSSGRAISDLSEFYSYVTATDNDDADKELSALRSSMLPTFFTIGSRLFTAHQNPNSGVRNPSVSTTGLDIDSRQSTYAVINNGPFHPSPTAQDQAQPTSEASGVIHDIGDRTSTTEVPLTSLARTSISPAASFIMPAGNFINSSPSDDSVGGKTPSSESPAIASLHSETIDGQTHTSSPDPSSGTTPLSASVSTSVSGNASHTQQSMVPSSSTDASVGDQNSKDGQPTHRASGNSAERSTTKAWQICLVSLISTAHGSWVYGIALC